MPVNTPLAAKFNAATVNFNTLFRQVLENTPTFWQKIATEMPSSTREEDYAWLDRIPQMREWKGERQINNASARMQTLVNKLYEDTVGIKRTDIEDDKIGIYRPLMEEVARSAAVWPDALVSAAEQAGAAAVCYDGQYFYDAAHPVNMDDANVTGPAGAATQANLLTTSALSSTTLSTAITTMASFCGADGKPMGIRGDMLEVPPQLEFTARRLLQSTMIARQVTLTGPTYGAAADTNELQGACDLLVNPYLANEATTWYLHCTKRAIKPFIFQLREAPEFAALVSPSDEPVFKTDQFLYGVRARGVAGYGPYFLSLKATA